MKKVMTIMMLMVIMIVSEDCLHAYEDEDGDGCDDYGGGDDESDGDDEEWR